MDGHLVKIDCQMNQKKTKNIIGLKLPEELMVVIRLNVLKDENISKDSNLEELGQRKKTLNYLNQLIIMDLIGVQQVHILKTDLQNRLENIILINWIYKQIIPLGVQRKIKRLLNFINKLEEIGIQQQKNLIKDLRIVLKNRFYSCLRHKYLNIKNPYYIVSEKKQKLNEEESQQNQNIQEQSNITSIQEPVQEPTQQTLIQQEPIYVQFYKIQIYMPQQMLMPIYIYPSQFSTLQSTMIYYLFLYQSVHLPIYSIQIISSIILLETNNNKVLITLFINIFNEINQTN